MSDEMMVMPEVEYEQDLDFTALRNPELMNFATSLPMETPEEKITVFNAFNTADHKLADFANKKIMLVHFLAHQVTVKSEETGLWSKQPRIILIDKDGKTYGCVSRGVASSIERLCAICGKPPWKDGLPVEPFISSARQNRKTMGLRVIVSKQP